MFFLCNFSTFLYFVFAFRLVKYSFCIFALVFCLFFVNKEIKNRYNRYFYFHLCKPNGERHCGAWGGGRTHRGSWFCGFLFSATYSLRTFPPLTRLHNCLFCYIIFCIFFFVFCFIYFFGFLVFIQVQNQIWLIQGIKVSLHLNKVECTFVYH